MDDVNIVKVSPLLPPACLIEELPVSAGLAQTIRATRKRVQASVGGQSDKLIVVVGQFWKRNPTPTPPFDRESALGNTALARSGKPLGTSRCGSLLLISLSAVLADVRSADDVVAFEGPCSIHDVEQGLEYVRSLPTPSAHSNRRPIARLHSIGRPRPVPALAPAQAHVWLQLHCIVAQCTCICGINWMFCTI